MADNPQHVHLVKELAEQLEPILSRSPQAIYLYLDDAHKTCNEKFAQLLGYTSVQEWVDNPFAVGDVAEKDQQKLINAYMDASKKFIGSTISVTFVSKKSQEIPVSVTLAPITYQNEVFVLHFISK